MRIRAVMVAVAALLLALSVAIFAHAGQTGRTIEASGVLEEEYVTVSIPGELALLATGDGGSADSANAKMAVPSGRRVSSPKPAGRIDALFVEAGEKVARGAALFAVSERLADENLKKAQARYEQLVATIESIEGMRDDLDGKQSDLSSKQAELNAKRAEAKREFTVKSNEGRAKIAGLEDKLASITSSLERARDGLAQVVRVEHRAREMLAAAQALPDSDPSKAGQVAQATGMLEAALKQKTKLDATIARLSQTQAQLSAGISRAERALATGEQQFSRGMAEMDAALAKIAEGKRSINEGAATLSRKTAVLQKRRDQAEVGVSLAGKIKRASRVTAGISGRISRLAVTQGAVVFPGQQVMRIVRDDSLKLSVHVPLADAARIKRGDAVSVAVDAAPGRTFTGKVAGIGGRAVFAPSNLTSKELELLRVVRVEITVKNEDGILKAGMPADIKIRVSGVSDA